MSLVQLDCTILVTGAYHHSANCAENTLERQRVLIYVFCCMRRSTVDTRMPVTLMVTRERKNNGILDY